MEINSRLVPASSFVQGNVPPFIPSTSVLKKVVWGPSRESATNLLSDLIVSVAQSRISFSSRFLKASGG